MVGYNKLPPSVNNYLKPSVETRGGRSFVHMYESIEAKDFKKMFREKLRREVKRQAWDISITGKWQWACDISIIQTRQNADSHNYHKILIDSMQGIVFINDSNVQINTPRVFIGNSNKQGFKVVFRQTENRGLFDNESLMNQQTSRCLSCRYYQEGRCSVMKFILESRLTGDFDHKNQVCTKYIKKKNKK